MKYNDYERDEVIRHGKKKSTKTKTTKAKHKHLYEEKYVPADGTGFNLDRTEKVCSVCGKIGSVMYHWKLNRLS